MEAVTFNRAALAYLFAAISTEILTRAANFVPAIRQPLLGFVLLRYACLYLLASKAFELRRGYHWLLLAAVFEIAIGLTGYIASYHAAFIIILLAAVSRGRRQFSIQQFFVMFVGMAALIWISVIWTAIKPDYRLWLAGGSNEEVATRSLLDRMSWISDRVTSGKIDYSEGALKLVERIGYTDFYAQTIARLDQGLIPDDINLWGSAVLHVAMPRALFPDKQSLDDTALTTLLTGQQFAKDTSVSIGYVAEAHADFGFPGMLVPIFLVGTMLGAAAQYFMTRPVPSIIKEAFTASCLFLAFSYAHNIDKEFGGFVTGFLALWVSLKFGYPRVSRWLSGASR